MAKNNIKNLKKSLDRLADGLIEARRLSQQRVDTAGNAEGYRLLLQQNRRRMTELAGENNRILDEVLFPMVEDDAPLSPDEISALVAFCDRLLVSWPEEDLDLTLHFLTSQRLYRDAMAKDDDDGIVQHAGRFITSCYNNLNRINRVRTSKKLPEFFKNQGMTAAQTVLSYLGHEAFSSLKKQESREAVLSYARFYLALYDTWYATEEEENEERIDGLVRAIDLAEDPFFVSVMKDYDWKKFLLRCYEHMGQLTENGNQWQMTRRQCQKILPHMQRMKQIWEEDESEGDQLLPRIHFELILARNEYYAQKTDLATYKKELCRLYEAYAVMAYDMYSVAANLLLPAEYLALCDGADLSDEDVTVLRRMYEKVAGFILNFRGSESFSFLLEYLSEFLERFIDLEDYGFEDMGLKCLAALNPPAYIHCLQTAHIARSLCSHIIRLRPECLIGVAGCGDMDQVFEKRETILQQIYHAGCVHEFGSFSMIDTTITDGRKKTKAESFVLDQEKWMSIHLLDMHDSTKNSAAILKEQQKLKDDPSGTNAILPEILEITSRITRAYEEGVAVGEIIRRQMSDYPDLYDVFCRPEVLDDIESILNRGSDSLYLDLWLMLRDVQKKEKLSLGMILEGYYERTARIRELSAPQITELSDATEYELLFSQQFREIGLLAAENKQMLSTELYPLLESEQGLSMTEAKTLQDFCYTLLNGEDLADVDQGLLYFISRRLLMEAHKKKDVEFLIPQLDIHVMSCYEMAHQTKRMPTAGSITAQYRKEGLSAAKEIWSFMEKDRFAALSDEAKELVLINKRYAVYLYETEYEKEGLNDIYIDLLRDAFDVAEDPFYLENAKAYDWNYHQIRSLEYMGQSTECGNHRQFTKAQCQTIASYMEKLLTLWERDPEGNAATLPKTSIMLMLNRSRYFGGQMDLLSYRDALREIYRTKRNGKYDFNSIFPNLVTPLELVISYEGAESYTPEEQEEIREIYIWLIEYVSRAKNKEAFSLLLEYFSEFVYHLIEIEGGLTFEEMGLYCMAALHPPTYIHSRMIGELSRRICRYLCRRSPRCFVGVLGCKDENEVLERVEEITEYCYHAGLCHDFGKIPMIDTIFVYGRNLLDHEFALLKHHTRVGGLLLSAHASTKAYADIALGHHKWYDDSRGYPEEFFTADSDVKTIIDIVTVADCLDAATDTVGRSYTGSKTPQQIMDEIIKDAGTRYSPDIAEILKEEDLRKEIEHILRSVRRDTYRSTFDLLSYVLAQDHGDFTADRVVELS